MRRRRTYIAGLFMLFVFRFFGLMLQILFGYRFEGAEHVPAEAPFILLPKEGGGQLAMLSIGFGFMSAMLRLMVDLYQKIVATLHEDLWFRYFSRIKLPMPLYPLRPVSGGMLSMGVLHQLRALREGGVAVINPEGDLCWDGRPLPIRPGAAWLGLHTGVPLVPFSVSPGAYDAWPRWQKRPRLGGQLTVRMGPPFRLSESPMEQVTPEDIEAANARIYEVLNDLCYGPGGVEEWAGPRLRDGALVEGPIHLEPPGEVKSTGGYRGGKRNWGIPQLLWQCPVCHRDDALLHKRPLFRQQRLECRACGTRWQVERIPGKDFRLKVVEGHPDVVGLDLPLSAWYDEMRAGFQLKPIPAGDLELAEGEEVYARAEEVGLAPYRPSTLFEEWASGEAPRVQPGGQDAFPGWEEIGTGQLLLTNERLLWKGPQGELEFRWPAFRAVFLPWMGVVGLTYGSAMYRLDFGAEAGRKWLAYVGTLAQEAAGQDGHEVSLAPF